MSGNEAALRRRLDKAGWTNAGNGGVAWLTVVARRTICVQVERYASHAWRASTLVVDDRNVFNSGRRRATIGEAHAPTFELAVGEAKRMRERIESQIEALLLDLSTKSDVDAKDHVINLTGLFGHGPWVCEGLSPLAITSDNLRDAYRTTKVEAHRLAEAYRRQYPDAKVVRVGPRKKAASEVVEPTRVNALLDGLEPTSCGSCHACPGEHQALMILCVTCGNKRCPKANDHNLACTNSNAPGQKGSAYP